MELEAVMRMTIPGDRLRQWLDAADMTQAELARLLSVDPGQVSRWCNGRAPLRGSYVINIGELMKRWTNGRFKSTPHRALPPVGRHRYAIPFFLGPQFDWVIECLPTCTGADNPPRWEPITYAAWQEYWYDANYDPKVQKDLVA
jgi:isopenicillin N synthase-like dioxygenase